MGNNSNKYTSFRILVHSSQMTVNVPGRSQYASDSLRHDHLRQLGRVRSSQTWHDDVMSPALALACPPDYSVVEKARPPCHGLHVLTTITQPSITSASSCFIRRCSWSVTSAYLSHHSSSLSPSATQTCHSCSLQNWYSLL